MSLGILLILIKEILLILIKEWLKVINLSYKKKLNLVIIIYSFLLDFINIFFNL